MGQKNIILELDAALNCLLGKVNAIELMTYGLSYVKDPYAGGFNELYLQLRESVDEMKSLLQTAEE